MLSLGYYYFAGIYVGVAPGAVFALFPYSHRCTIASITYNIAIIFAGFVPIVCTLLLVEGDMFSHSMVMIFCCIIALVSWLSISPHPDKLPE